MPMNKTTPLHSATKSADAKKTTDKAQKARSDALALLTEFSNQGFRKTSMVALASAIGMSRQTLYNRFQTKELVLQWATSELVALLKLDAIGYLADTTRSTGMILWATFC
jgi:AcrR family transcriptional regulator